MKSIIIFIFAALLCLGAIASPDKVIKDTTIKGTTYHLYMGSKGGRYIVMTSKTTGKEYKRYFKHNWLNELAKQVSELIWFPLRIRG